jgi:ABC-type glycerol-3-phosphate transport system permease component
MKNSTAGTLSGCVVWIVVMGIVLSCILPVFFIIGSFTSFSEYAVTFTGKYVCPAGTTPQGYTYETTTTDEYGHQQPAIAKELHCIDQAGTVVKNDPIVYAFLWIGIFALLGLILSGILAFALAAPAGVLVTRILNRRQKTDISANIEPQ